MAAARTDAVVIKEYFGMSLPEARAELTGPDGLTKEDKADLAQGIRDGSLTYPGRGEPKLLLGPAPEREGPEAA
jgi:hypothetical protein